MEGFSHPGLLRAAVIKLKLTPWLWQRKGGAGAEVKKVLPGGLGRDIWPLRNGSLSIWRALLSWPPPCFCLLSHASLRRLHKASLINEATKKLLQGLAFTTQSGK